MLESLISLLKGIGGFPRNCYFKAIQKKKLELHQAALFTPSQGAVEFLPAPVKACSSLPSRRTAATRPRGGRVPGASGLELTRAGPGERGAAS